MKFDFYTLLKYTYYGLLFAGLLVGILRWKKLDKSLLVFLPLFFFDILTEIATDRSRQASFMYHIDQAISCFLLCGYYFLLFKNKKQRSLVWIGFLVYLAAVIPYFIGNPANFFKYDPIDFVIEGVVMTTFSLYYLVDLYSSDEPLFIPQHPHFWISVGNLLFYSGSSIFMGFAFTLRKENHAMYNQLSYIVYFLNLIVYSIYIKAFLCHFPAKRPG